MFRIIAACTLGLAAVTALPASPAMADKSWRSSLDDAEPIPTSWTATGRFAQLTLAWSDEVIVRRGDRWQIRASGSPAVIADLRFEVEDGDLLIGRRWRRTPVAGMARIEVIAPDVEAVTLAGSGMLRVDTMNGEEVDVTVAGSGTLDIGRVDATRLSATIAGSGDLEVAGRADRSQIGHRATTHIKPAARLGISHGFPEPRQHGLLQPGGGGSSEGGGSSGKGGGGSLSGSPSGGAGALGSARGPQSPQSVPNAHTS